MSAHESIARLGCAWLMGYREMTPGNLVAPPAGRSPNKRGQPGMGRRRHLPDPLRNNADSMTLRAALVALHYRVQTETTLTECEAECGPACGKWEARAEGHDLDLLDEVGADALERIALVRLAMQVLPLGVRHEMEMLLGVEVAA
jgi:hypothetical protein